MKEPDPQKKKPIHHGPAKRLACVIGDLKAGGAQRVLKVLSGGWADRGWNVSVITLAGPEADFFRLDPRIRRLALDRQRPSRSVLAAVAANIGRIRALRRTLRDVDPETVVSFIGTTNILTILAARGLRCRVVISERNDPESQSLGPIFNTLRRLTYPLADRVTANSQGAVESLSAFVPARKLAYLPNPAPKVEADPPPAGSRRPTILSVGRLAHQKGHDILLKAFAGIAGRVPDWNLVIIGEGTLLTSLQSEARSLGIDDHIAWPGRVADLAAYYESAGIFALPSRYEGTPNALQEAMAHRLPCVVTDASPGPLALIEHDVTGMVVAPENPHALAETLTRLIEDSALRERLGEAAGTRAETPTLDQTLESWAKVIDIDSRD